MDILMSALYNVWVAAIWIAYVIFLFCLRDRVLVLEKQVEKQAEVIEVLEGAMVERDKAKLEKKRKGRTMYD